MSAPLAQLGYGTAILRGLRRHCPRCDSRTLFLGYLKVRPRCPVCAADNGQHRVDDIASYFTVLLVGHIVVAPTLAIPYFWNMPLWASLGIILTGVTGVTLAMLPFIKGGVIGGLAASQGTTDFVTVSAKDKG